MHTVRLCVHRLMGRVVLLMALGVLVAAPAFADTIVPSPDVITAVVVRASASIQSARVGRLAPGDQALLLGSVPNWYRVQLANGTRGFVSQQWTQVVPVGPGPPSIGAT